MMWRLLNKFSQKYYINNTVFNAKYNLKLLKYNSLQFFALPDDMSGGSRELLIAFAYLLGNGNLNSIVLEELKKSLLNKDFTPENDFIIKVNNVQRNSCNIECRTTMDCENLLEWIKGKIFYNRKLIEEYTSCSEKMAKKVNITKEGKEFDKKFSFS